MRSGEVVALVVAGLDGDHVVVDPRVGEPGIGTVEADRVPGREVDVVPVVVPEGEVDQLFTAPVEFVAAW